ncbi:ZN180 protein, partial [Mystacornis crossleyi]|nr:ZN180 protein [Mystacornis crossleyi]
FAWSSHLDRHMRTHMTTVAAGDEEGVEAEEEPPPAPWKCADCGKRLNHQTDPQRFKHKGTQTPLGGASADLAPQPHRCEQCGKYFSHSSGLLKHQRMHSSEWPHPCPDCPRRFRCSAALAKHRRGHAQPLNNADNATPATEEAAKPYPCGACGKSFG